VLARVALRDDDRRPRRPLKASQPCTSHGRKPERDAHNRERDRTSDRMSPGGHGGKHAVLVRIKKRPQLLGVHRPVGRPRGPQADLGARVACRLHPDQRLDIHHGLSTAQDRIHVASDGTSVEGADPSDVFVEEPLPVVGPSAAKPNRTLPGTSHDHPPIRGHLEDERIRRVDSGDTWIAVHVDEVERVDWRRTGISWRPLRRALGADIVGIAAFTADQPGEVIVEPHSEVDDGRGQQEIYLVLRGTARFRIDGADIEASAGTLLRVDAQAHREAIAIDAGTAVIALGGESTFDPSPSEWIERARPHIRTDPLQAREIFDDLRRNCPHDPANDVAEALLAIGQGNDRRARSIVRQLVSDLPQLRSVLVDDPDLRDLLPE
jgi:hypothetical protein